ncbi:MAG: transcriptional regulator [Verrucomicrobiae bacterium]|nr:transcriptional regulator [Verrucomicrobiae bacterium]MCP5541331.1 transcriptional regulator [Akkermansiaceae bacterium]
MIDFDKLDKLIHEKGRLAIMTLLAARAEWRFQDLKGELNMSDGNLVTHLRTLFKAGYVSITKEMDTRPQTKYALTEKGRTAFREYLAVLEQILKSGRS